MEKTPVYLIMTTAENNNKYYNCFQEKNNCDVLLEVIRRVLYT